MAMVMSEFAARENFDCMEHTHGSSSGKAQGEYLHGHLSGPDARILVVFNEDLWMSFLHRGHVAVRQFYGIRILQWSSFKFDGQVIGLLRSFI